MKSAYLQQIAEKVIYVYEIDITNDSQKCETTDTFGGDEIPVEFVKNNNTLENFHDTGNNGKALKIGGSILCSS